MSCKFERNLMGRGTYSLTASRNRVNTPFGSYPSSIESLVDANGHISLNPRDYDGFTEEEIKSFFSSLEYEVSASFAPDGSLVRLFSQFDDDEVSVSYDDYEREIADAQRASGVSKGYTDFHNHPTMFNDGTIEIWSPKDMMMYANQAGYHDSINGKVILGACDIYQVRTSNGHEFKLEFDPSLKSPFQAADYIYLDYERQFNTVFREECEKWKNGTISREQACDNVTDRLDAWLRLNANVYGFKYTTNWK